MNKQFFKAIFEHSVTYKRAVSYLGLYLSGPEGNTPWKQSQVAEVALRNSAPHYQDHTKGQWKRCPTLLLRVLCDIAFKLLSIEKKKNSRREAINLSQDNTGELLNLAKTVCKCSNIWISYIHYFKNSVCLSMLVARYQQATIKITYDQALFSFRSVKHSGGGKGETKIRAWYKSSMERLPPTFLIDWHSTKQPIRMLARSSVCKFPITVIRKKSHECRQGYH